MRASKPLRLPTPLPGVGLIGVWLGRIGRLVGVVLLLTCTVATLAEELTPVYALEPEDEPTIVLSLTDRAARSVDRSTLRPSRLVIGDDGQTLDLSIPDMRHNLSVLSDTYRHVFNELRVIVVSLKQSLPIFSLYRGAQDHCLLGLNSAPNDWRRVTEKLNLFTPEDDLLVFKEIAMAHEVGHCMAVKHLESINRRWDIASRELFADIFALIHVHVHLDDRREEALQQLLRFRAGGPPDPSRPQVADILRIDQTLLERMPMAEPKDQWSEFWVELALDLMQTLATQPGAGEGETDVEWFMRN